METWEHNEINVDTMYSFSPCTQTATEYLWIENTNKKVAKPSDTITFRTDGYLINGMKLYEVKKINPNTARTYQSGLIVAPSCMQIH